MENRVICDFSVLIMILHHCNILKSSLFWAEDLQSASPVWGICTTALIIFFSSPFFETPILCTWKWRVSVQICTKYSWFWRNWANIAANLVFCFYFLLLSWYSSCSSVHSWALSWWCILQCSLLLLQYVFRDRNIVFRDLKLFDRMSDVVWGLLELCFGYCWRCRKTSTSGSGQCLWNLGLLGQIE